ncbi:MAG: hypothetical protein M1820_009457 [Bogoriella megaspora]|nr:MAG: hypothetical protein M1820_009457 [Bogoriella megaspora]
MRLLLSLSLANFLRSPLTLAREVDARDAFYVTNKRQSALPVLRYGTSPNGFRDTARGWNSFGLQANPSAAPNFQFNQDRTLNQCERLNAISDTVYCSVGSGWSVGGNGDDNGRPIPNTTVFPDLPGLANQLHAKGLKIGIYVLPGGFEADANKTPLGTDIQIGSLFNTTVDEDSAFSNFFNARVNWNYTKDGGHRLHQTRLPHPRLPRKPPPPGNSSLSALFYHNAIQRSGASIYLSGSWELDRSSVAHLTTWDSSVDSLRTDTDINNADSLTLISFSTVQRAIEQYRQFITTTPSTSPIPSRPDMDNLYVGNPSSITGLSDVQRYTVAIHWLGAGANLLTGSDLTTLDTLGETLLGNAKLYVGADPIAAFTAQFPMQPRGQAGGATAQQVQSWIAGPDDGKTAVVVLANYGPDEGEGGFGTSLSGIQDIVARFGDLGLEAGTYEIRRVLGGGGSGGGDFEDIGTFSGSFDFRLEEGESALYRFAPAT